MKYIIAYDIREDSARDRCFKILSCYGRRIQFSVFECELNRFELIELKKMLMKIIDKEHDRVNFWRLCSSCDDDSFHIGAEIESYGNVLVF